MKGCIPQNALGKLNDGRKEAHLECSNCGNEVERKFQHVLRWKNVKKKKSFFFVVSDGHEGREGWNENEANVMLSTTRSL